MPNWSPSGSVIIKPMRILNSTTLHGWSAGSWYAIEMMRGLAGRGHEIHMLVPEGRTAEASRVAGFEVHTTPDLRTVPPSAWKATIRSLKELRDKVVRPDIILAHYGPDHSWWGAIAGPPQRRIPLVRVRAHDPREPSSHPVSIWLHRRRTDAFIVSNELQRRSYVGRHKFRSDQVFRIPPGFDLKAWEGGGDGSEIRRQCGIGAETLLVASVARFAPQKDHATFFKAADYLARSALNVHFLVAGYPAEFETSYIQNIVETYSSLHGRYTLWTERLSDGRPLVRAADIGVIHSSGSEAICRVAMEYMASGIPLVATRIGILPEVIHEGINGLLVSPGHAKSLAGALYRLIESESLRSRLGKAGRRRLEEVFSYERAVGKLDSILQKMVKQE